MTSECLSISEWIRQLEDGDADAAQNLWDRFFDRLMRVVEHRIGGRTRGQVEAEDITVSVFESLWKAAQLGRFERIQDRHELWWLLLRMARRKTASAIVKAKAQKRGGSSRPVHLDDDKGCGYLELVSDEPTPEEVAALDEEFRRAIDLLPDQSLKEIAVLTLEGYTTEEISERVDVATATVTRKRKLIRDTWKRELLE